MSLLNVKLLAEHIDSIAESDFCDHKVFGSAYFVYQDGMAFEKCYGTEDLGSDRMITPSSVFRLASMTKPITAVATLILVERGLLSLEDRVDRFLPELGSIEIKELGGKSYPAKKIPTVKSILTHTSGIASVWEKCAGMSAEDCLTLDSSIAFFIKNGLDFEPDSMQMYSGTGAFDVLTKIIEIVTQKDYLEFLKEEIFSPCGMPDTTFAPTAEQRSRMVAMHDRRDDRNAVFEMPDGCVFEGYPPTHYLGGAGLVSTLHDYANFAKMLLNKGQTENGRILKESTFLQLCTPQVSKEIMPGSERWGLGVRVIAEDSYPYLPKGSYGWSGAYGSHFWIDPENRIAAVFMKNSRHDGGAGNQSARNFEKAVYSSVI